MPDWFIARCKRRGVPQRHLWHFWQGIQPSILEEESNAAAQASEPWEDVESAIEAAIVGGIFAMIGPRGPGKTQIATNICARHIWEARHVDWNDGKQPLYAKALDVFARIRSSYHKLSSETEIEVIQQFVTPALLVIDELDKKGNTEFEDRMLAHIIDKRYDALGATIIISNLDRKRMQEALGLSIVSRIMECGRCFECDWPSFRMKGG
jgi:DNA replication protein DnaC